MKRLLILIVVLFGLSFTPQVEARHGGWFPGRNVARFVRNRQPVRSAVRAVVRVRPLRAAARLASRPFRGCN